MYIFYISVSQIHKDSAPSRHSYPKKVQDAKGIASFLGFAWPKTTLTPGTERGLTSEFGMGSGGSRALWPATPIDSSI